jgi:ubiquinone/menaquinone biosynthesis C-methylase UbiE
MKLNKLEFALMNNPVRAWSQRRLETPLLIGPPGALRGLRVLEVGCGRGIGIEILVEQLGAAEVVGFDIDPEMVALAKERTAHFGDRVRIFVGDAERIDAPDASFDAVVEFGILHHVPDWRRALAEINRVLKPDGAFYFEDVLKDFTSAPLLLDLFDHPQVTQFTGDEFRQAVTEAGLELSENWRQLGEVGLMGRARKPDQGTEEVAEPVPPGFRLPMAVHTWYGFNGEVRAAGAGACDTAVEGRALPHPSLVNLYLRRGLSPIARTHLGAWHEAGHLQTLPLAGLYVLALTASILLRPQRAMLRFLLALLGGVTLWELASETYTVAKVSKAVYREAYSGARLPGLIRLATFWLGGGLVALLAPFLVARETRPRSKRTYNP